MHDRRNDFGTPAVENALLLVAAFCRAISISISQVSSRLQTLSDFPLNHVPVLEKKATNRMYTTLAHPVESVLIANQNA